MSNPLSAVTGIAAQAAGAPDPAAAFRGVTVNAGALAESSGSSGAGEAFRSMVGSFQSQAASFENGGAALPSDPVAAAKAEFASGAEKDGRGMLLGPAKPGDAAAGAATTSDGGVTVLRKSFDHAIFVTLVSQIVGGVTQATTTLVRQQ